MQLSGTCPCAWEEGRGTAIWFPSAIPTPTSRPGYPVTRDSELVHRKREREREIELFSHLLHHLFFSHAAEQKVRPEFSACPWEAVYQDWVSLQDVCFIFLHYEAFWNSILLATGLVFGTEGTGCEADRPGLVNWLLRVGRGWACLSTSQARSVLRPWTRQGGCNNSSLKLSFSSPV